MKIIAVKVSPEVARLRQNDGGTRRCAVIFTFASTPTYFAGELPPEIETDAHLIKAEVREAEARDLAEKSVHAFALPSEKLRARTPPPVALMRLGTALSDLSLDELRQLYGWTLGEKPHGKKGEDTLRQHIRAALGIQQ